MPTDQLTAPELLLINGGGTARGHHAMRLTLMELAARGFITTRREGNMFRRKVFVRRLSNEEPERPYMAEVLAATGTGEDMLIQDLFKSMQVRFERNFNRLISHGAGPELQRRGLIEERRVKMFGIIPVTRNRLTPAGEERRAALQRQLEEGSRLPKLLKLAPADAVAIATALGPAVLLAPEMRGHFQDLAIAIRTNPRHDPAYDGATYWHWGAMDSSGGEDNRFDSDFGSDFDSLDSSFDAFDSGSSDSASGGDGDGGGGDGGGD